MRFQSGFAALADRVAMETRAVERAGTVQEILAPAGWSDAQAESWLDWLEAEGVDGEPTGDWLTGGRVDAFSLIDGSLAIMVGGEEDVFRRALPVFECMGKTIRYQGKAGSGQHTKMANQIAIAGTAAGVAEALSYAKAAGLDPAATLDAISGGSAVSWQMLNNGPKMLKRDFAPGFFIKHFIKDMSLAREEAEDRDLSLPVLTQVLELYRALADKGLGDEGTQAIIRAYDKE